MSYVSTLRCEVDSCAPNLIGGRSYPFKLSWQIQTTMTGRRSILLCAKYNLGHAVPIFPSTRGRHAISILEKEVGQGSDV